jgi:hypothetical protein
MTTLNTFKPINSSENPFLDVFNQKPNAPEPGKAPKAEREVVKAQAPIVTKPNFKSLCRLGKKFLTTIGKWNYTHQRFTLRGFLCEYLELLGIDEARTGKLYTNLKRGSTSENVKASWKELGITKEELEQLFAKNGHPQPQEGAKALEGLFLFCAEIFESPLGTICSVGIETPMNALLAKLESNQMFCGEGSTNFKKNVRLSEAIIHLLLLHWQISTAEGNENTAILEAWNQLILRNKKPEDFLDAEGNVVIPDVTFTGGKLTAQDLEIFTFVRTWLLVAQKEGISDWTLEQCEILYADSTVLHKTESSFPSIVALAYETMVQILANSSIKIVPACRRFCQNLRIKRAACDKHLKTCIKNDPNASANSLITFITPQIGVLLDGINFLLQTTKGNLAPLHDVKQLLTFMHRTILTTQQSSVQLPMDKKDKGDEKGSIPEDDSRSLDLLYERICEGDSKSPSPPTSSSPKPKKKKNKRKSPVSRTQSPSSTTSLSATPSPTSSSRSFSPSSSPDSMSLGATFGMKVEEMAAGLKSAESAMAAQVKARKPITPNRALSSFALTLAKDYRSSELSERSADASLRARHSEFAHEISDHIFLASQGLELFAEAASSGRTHEAFASVLNFLIDTHVACEQHFNLAYLKKKEDLLQSHTHDLVERARLAGIDLSNAERRFLQEHARILIWARYPFTSLQHFRGQPPAPLQWIRTLSGKPNAQELARIFHEMIDTYKNMLTLVLGEEYQDSLKQLESFCQQMEKALASSLEQNLVIPSKTQSKELTILQNLRSNLEKAVLPLPAARESTILLKEACHCLRWQEAALRMRLDHPEENLHFWHTRNTLKLDAAFEAVYRAHQGLLGLEASRSHHLADHHKILAEWEELSLDEASQKKVLAISQGIASHYLHVQEGPWTSLCKNLITYAENATLTPEGFTFASNSGAKENVSAASTTNLHLSVSQAIPHLQTQVGKLLQTLQEVHPATPVTAEASTTLVRV